MPLGGARYHQGGSSRRTRQAFLGGEVAQQRLDSARQRARDGGKGSVGAGAHAAELGLVREQPAGGAGDLLGGMHDDGAAVLDQQIRSLSAAYSLLDPTAKWGGPVNLCRFYLLRTSQGLMHAELYTNPGKDHSTANYRSPTVREGCLASDSRTEALPQESSLERIGTGTCRRHVTSRKLKLVLYTPETGVADYCLQVFRVQTLVCLVKVMLVADGLTNTRVLTFFR